MAAIEFTDDFFEYANKHSEKWTDSWITHFETWNAARAVKLPLMRYEVYEKLGCPIVEGVIKGLIREGVATQRYREIVDDVYDLLEQQSNNHG